MRACTATAEKYAFFVAIVVHEQYLESSAISV